MNKAKLGHTQAQERSKRVRRKRSHPDEDQASNWREQGSVQERAPHVRRAMEKGEEQGVQATENATEREEKRQRPHRTSKEGREGDINNGCKCK